MERIHAPFYRMVTYDDKGNKLANCDAPAKEQAKVKATRMVIEGKAAYAVGPYWIR